MIIVWLTITALVFFCTGAFLVFKGYWQAAGILNKNADQEVVPIFDPMELDSLKQSFTPKPILETEAPKIIPAENTLAQKMETTISESASVINAPRPVLALLQEESTQTETKLLQKIEELTVLLHKQEEESKKKILELRDDKKIFEDALMRELSSKEPSNAMSQSTELKDLKEQLIQSEHVVKNLTEENQTFRQQIQEQSDRINMLKNRISTIPPVEQRSAADTQMFKETEEKLATAQLKISLLTEENQHLNVQLQSQIDQVKGQLIHSDHVIKNLTEENKTYREQIQEQSDRINMLKNRISSIPPVEQRSAVDVQIFKETEEKLVTTQQTITLLTEENQRINMQLQLQIDQVNELNTEAFVLRSRCQELESKEIIKLEALQQEIDFQKRFMFEDRQSDLANINKLKIEKRTLIEQYTNQIRSLEANMRDLYSKYLQELSKQKLGGSSQSAAETEELRIKLGEAQQTLADLKEQKLKTENKNNELSVELNSLKDSLAIKQRSEISNEEKQKLLHNINELSGRCEKFQTENTLLLEKKKLLVYELSKSRAQALGLERICKDLKNQMDQVTV
ncbi:MAG: hypothetical protein KBD53_02220 [Candidatus Omnitrophica bacterium]|nr:hypothetical protein [Candidatus Omnitrophota bacterium]